jgi:hypothetical protein
MARPVLEVVRLQFAPLTVRAIRVAVRIIAWPEV